MLMDYDTADITYSFMAVYNTSTDRPPTPGGLPSTLHQHCTGYFASHSVN